ncbi:hypothetical protein GCM10011415_26450 [Salipiger pallidus]|uniref:Uncharacterized protein n=1 Tax=Salipiger pallidus TaxID=1775170 RepID=A0A8J2ZL78_9RHOB|nr:hypothetical protein [Salipiger pallidus]GGG76427.1 hypothetical protein GCM10011415_26450 [Salipiger pallidus]
MKEHELRPYRRSLGMLFQQINVVPHMSALGAIMETPVSAQGRPRAEVKAEAEALMAKVRLLHRASAHPN